MQYQFQVDGRPAGPVRKTWESVVRDVVRAGYGFETMLGGVKLAEGAEIARIGESHD